MEFGKSDKIYDLMKAYTMEEGSTWMVRPGFVHSPGKAFDI